MSLSHGKGHLHTIMPWALNHDPIPELREARPTEVKTVNQGCAAEVRSGYPASLGSVPSLCHTAMVGSG